ncbi:uncharacterized protein V1510DRAFT_422345 [Dipodascopsis tothii]|uniref:uncharacterized protein n=1 Tax=Dipodascopsis tothii TaxID=44089 RepID=UPI0034CFBBA0
MEITSNHLIILPCHSIWKGYEGFDKARPGVNPDEWTLASFQRENLDNLIFIKHIEEAVRQLNEDPEAILLFSGGQTNKSAGPISEAQSYWFLGQALGLYDEPAIRARISTEEFARDSFENTLFSIYRFKELTQVFPKRLTIVGFKFKEDRFVQQHAKHLGLQTSNVSYIGIDPELHNSQLYGKVEAGERSAYAIELEHYMKNLRGLEYKNAVQHFATDPTSSKSPLLDKKSGRDPYHRGFAYENKNSIDALIQGLPY